MDEQRMNEQRTFGVQEIEPVIKPDLDALYVKRAARLRHLAQDHAMGDYLRFIARIVDWQASVRPKIAEWVPGLEMREKWQYLLAPMIEALSDGPKGASEAVLQRIAKMDKSELQRRSKALIASDYSLSDPAESVYLWSALSPVWAQWANQAPCPPAGERVCCPICGAQPVGSLILTGNRAGLRYLHCSLCESLWHMVRSKCSCCGDAERVEYWAEGEVRAAIQAESCGKCNAYLKVFSLEKDQMIELVADDLASLAIDAAMEQEGFKRSGVNPFSFPGL